MPSRFCLRASRVATTVSALAFAFGAGTAFAQPFGGPPHGGHGGPPRFEAVIAQLKGQLNLDTSQQTMWDNAVAATRTAREQGRGIHDKVHATVLAELAKAEPDLAAIATAMDGAADQGRSLRRQVRDEWLKLYATFSPAQKAIVRDALVARLERFEKFRQHRFGGG